MHKFSRNHYTLKVRKKTIHKYHKNHCDSLVIFNKNFVFKIFKFTKEKETENTPFFRLFYNFEY